MIRTASRAPTEEEFVELVHAAWPSLYRTGMLLVGDHALAEDLVQTALAKTYANWHRVREPAAARGYARRVMVTTATSWFRRRSFSERPTDELPEQRERYDATSRDPGDRIDLLAALGQLPPRQRAVVVLRFYDDLSVREAATALGVSEGTVKSQTSAALDKLRVLLGDDVELPAAPIGPAATTTTGGHHA